MLQTCLKLVLIQFRLYNPNYFSHEKWCLGRGCSDYVIRKNHVARPIFWRFRITKSGKIRICEKLNFSPYNKGKHEFRF